VAPGPEGPEAVARFAGAWTGAWGEGRGEALCHTLVVEEVWAHGYAQVIYSIGTSASRGVRQRMSARWSADSRQAACLRRHPPPGRVIG
jgi:hypothetical protein